MSCPQEPIPAGWYVWRKTAVPDPLEQFAIDVRDHVRSYPYGAIAKTIDYQGTTVGAFVSHHTWTWRNGVLVTGICIPGVSLVVKQSGVGGTLIQDSLDSPDPTAAVYGADDLPSPPQKTDWGLVAVCGILIAGVVGAVVVGVRAAGRAR